MAIRRIFYLLGVIISIFSFNAVTAQAGLCPSNLDFESGSFANWTCRSGTVSVAPGVNTVSLTGTGQIPGRHTIISAATAVNDPYGGFPQICPNGSGYSVMLGNNSGGHQAESISYDYTIPSTLTVFSMIFHYAVVLQNPNHSSEEQPRFRARITDLTTNAPIPCVTFDFTASGSLPGFVQSPVNGTVVYKDWTPITVNLSAYIGRTIQLEFITSDCIFQAHFGYAYVDVNTNCNGAISGTTICQGDNSITLTAPYGFQSYEWFSDNTFSTLLTTSQTVPLNPPPAVGTVFPVIVTPYPGFGCRDTLYATITVAPKPVSVAGPDINGCTLPQVQIGGTSTPGYTYAWTPVGQVNNPTVSNPLGWTIPPNPAEFIVRTTDILTGCFSYDTTIVSNTVVDTTINVNGSLSFCNGTPTATLTVHNASAPVQWYNNGIAIPGATSLSYLPPAQGNYWAEITQNGCTDSTSTIPVTNNPLPQASFSPNNDTLCVTNNSFLFTNTSTVADNSAMTYNWKFSDGGTSQTTDAVKTFAAVGNHDAELVATSAFGCKDTVSLAVYVLPNGIPNFSWDSICINRPVLFKNLSNENGSVSSTYNWNFNDGGSGATVKNPLPVIYTTGGSKNVSLQITNLGCETDPITITKPVLTHAPPPGIRYPSITVPQGSTKFIQARNILGNSFVWKPQLQLNRYNNRYAEFTASGNDVQYLIDIADQNTCVTTDTFLVQILKKPGFYLPTGFTPNGDGLNDVVTPYLIGMKSLKSFSVFNRWGNLVFYSTKYGEGWNGKYKGTNQDAGVFVWVLEFIDSDDKKVVERGTLALIR
jgi:gliding motility-associated-like protein